MTDTNKASPKSQDRQARKSQAERKSESEKKLFDALVDIVNREGVSAATCERIGHEAGYSRGLTTTRLGRRDTMYARLMDRLYQDQVDRLAEQNVDNLSGLDALRKYADLHFEDIQHKAGYRAYFVLVAASLTELPSIRDRVLMQHELVQTLLASFFERAVKEGELAKDTDCRQRAAILGSFLFGVAMQSRLSEKEQLGPIKQGAYDIIDLGRCV